MPYTFPDGHLGSTGFSLCAVLWHGGRPLGTGLCLPSVGKLTALSARSGVGLLLPLSRDQKYVALGNPACKPAF